MRPLLALSLSVFLLPSVAEAGRCDGYVRRAASATGDKLVDAYRRLASCDAEVARAELWTFMKRADTLDTLSSLSLEGIRADAFNDLWKGMDQLAYDQRAPLAEAIGEACADEPGVLTMLQGAYVALKGSAFGAWEPAMEACGSEELLTWMESVVTDPPDSEYNAKYNAMLTAYVGLKDAEALPALEQAAIAAGEGGPTTSILDMMQRSIQPESMRAEVDPVKQEALAASLGRVGAEVGPKAARLVADRLYTAGRESQAAALLPQVYPDVVGADGAVTWAAASIEQCDDKVVVHWATLTESPPTHWAVQPLVEVPLRAVKPKLKCDAGEWPVRVSDAPVADDKAAKAWAEEIAASVAGEGVKPKVVQEKKAW